jgi:hypothetical protein
MRRTLLAAAALISGMSTACLAGGYEEGYAPRPAHRHRAGDGRDYRSLPKPYRMGAGGLIIVDEPYGAWMHERAVRTRSGILWGR